MSKVSQRGLGLTLQRSQSGLNVESATAEPLDDPQAEF